LLEKKETKGFPEGDPKWRRLLSGVSFKVNNESPGGGKGRN